TCFDTHPAPARAKVPAGGTLDTSPKRKRGEGFPSLALRACEVLSASSKVSPVVLGARLSGAQLAAQGLHPTLDQPGGGGGVPGDVRQRPALQMAQPNRLALVVRQRRQCLSQALRFLPPHDLLAGGG